MTRAERPHTIEAKIEGKPHGIVGRLSATSIAQFHGSRWRNIIQYAVEASLTGRLAASASPC